MIHPYFPGFVAQTGLAVANTNMVGRKTPAKYSSGESKEALGAAAKARVEKVAPESTTNQIKLVENYPDADEPLTVSMSRNSEYASHNRGYDPTTKQRIGSVININPNNSREYLAHELGHHVTDQTKIGNLVRNLRSNPKLSVALGAAAGGLGLPFVQSSLQEGDDDLASGIAIATLLNSPKLIDEALATKNALAIMKDAGMPATMGQRGRLAGGYLSYAAVPIMAGLTGNLLGNVADDYTAVYNLGEGELPM